MKQLFTLFLLVFCAQSALALPVGNPADPNLLCDGFFFNGSCCSEACAPGSSWCDSFSFRLGYYGDFVFQRSMEIDRHEDSSFIEDTEIFTNAAYFVVNVWDRVDFFATVGATNIDIETNASSFSGGPAGFTLVGNRFWIETDTNYSWSLGGRVTLWECGCTTIGVEAQYFYCQPNIRRVAIVNQALTALGLSNQSIYPDNIDLKYREWQFGLGIAHRINHFVPYAAIKWSRAKMDMDNARFIFLSANEPATIPVTLYNLESRKDVGYAIGVTWIDCEKLSLGIEARFADEKALYLNGQARF